jgi:hypothetical protein
MTYQPFLCPQCGVDLAVPKGEVFFPCSSCTSALYLDKSKAVFHYSLTSTLSQETAERTLKRWMAGNETVKDLDRKAIIETPALRHFPFWHFKILEDVMETYTSPAAETTFRSLRQFRVPPGELRFHDPEIAAGSISPSIPSSVALKRLGHWEASTPDVQETALVHVPLYFFYYHYRGETYLTGVDGSSGQVLSDDYPTRKELPYRVMAMITFLVFFLEAFIAYLVLPWVGGRLYLAYALRCCIQLVTALPFIGLVWWITQKT